MFRCLVCAVLFSATMVMIGCDSSTPKGNTPPSKTLTPDGTGAFQVK
jgi:hypothetical protein